MGRNQHLQEKLQQHLQDILHKNYRLQDSTFILLIYDQKSTLSILLANAYKKVIQPYSHRAIDFDTYPEQQILDQFAQLPPRSLVIIVQSLSFRMTKHRLRADLFQAGHQVIEHARLSYNSDDQIGNYVNSLSYDTPYYVQMSTALEKLLQEDQPLRIESGNNLVLTIQPPYEKVIKNTGDFSANPITASGFPIGELFTEAKNLTGMNGSVVVFGFPNEEHKASFTEPFTVTIENGLLINHTGPAEFEKMMELIRSEDSLQRIHVREIGFGLNRALGFNHRITEPTSFERFCGLHFSLGLKHDMYRKKMDKKILQRFHVDIFCNVDRAFIGNKKIFENGEYVL